MSDLGDQLMQAYGHLPPNERLRAVFDDIENGIEAGIIFATYDE